MIDVVKIMSIFKLFLFFTLIFWGYNTKNGTIELDSNINHCHINDTINEYLSKIPENYSKWEEDERLALNNYLSLKELPSNKPKLISEIKEQLLQKFSKEFNKNLTQINTVFLT